MIAVTSPLVAVISLPNAVSNESIEASEPPDNPDTAVSNESIEAPVTLVKSETKPSFTVSTDSTNDTISANVSRSNEEPDNILLIAVSLAPAKVSNESIEASASSASSATRASNESIETVIAVTSPLVAKISAAKSDEIASA